MKELRPKIRHIDVITKITSRKNSKKPPQRFSQKIIIIDINEQTKSSSKN